MSRIQEKHTARARTRTSCAIKPPLDCVAALSVGDASHFDKNATRWRVALPLSLLQQNRNDACFGAEVPPHPASACMVGVCAYAPTHVPARTAGIRITVEDNAIKQRCSATLLLCSKRAMKVPWTNCRETNWVSCTHVPGTCSNSGSQADETSASVAARALGVTRGVRGRQRDGPGGHADCAGNFDSRTIFRGLPISVRSPSRQGVSPKALLVLRSSPGADFAR